MFIARSVLAATLAVAVIATAGAADPLMTPKKRVAVLVGVSKYDNDVGKLENPAKDIRVIRERLIRIGFKPENIISLVSAEKTESGETAATKKGVNDALLAADEKCNKKEEEDSLLLVYVAGHGAMVKGKLAFKPSDAKNGNVETYLDQQLLIDQIMGSPARRKLVILEICQTVEGASTPNPDADKKAEAALVKKLRDSRTVLVTTASPGSESFGGGPVDAGPDMGQNIPRGFFAHYFIRGLQRDGAVGDQVSLPKTVDFAARMTRDTGKQAPRVLPDEELKAPGWGLSLGNRRGLTLKGEGRAVALTDEQRDNAAAALSGITADTTEPFATFTNINLSKAATQDKIKFTGILLTLATFKDVDLTGVDFTGSDLSFATFENVILKGAKFGPGTLLIGTKFKGRIEVDGTTKIDGPALALADPDARKTLAGAEISKSP